MLVAVDLSETSPALVSVAVGLASRLFEQLRAQIEGLLARSGVDPRRARIVIGKGQPADVILERACRGDVDLIVMGTHGRTGLQRLLVGSVAEGVLRRAPCPVVVVPYAMLLEQPRPPQARAGTS
jgi:nucleotide-binding universal stress UspA family protein